MEARITKRFGTHEVRLTKTWMPTEVGDLAIRFATHFGIVAAKHEGEDTAGRAKLELQTVEEIVQRSCDLAEKLVAELKKREWTLELPDLPDDEEFPPPKRDKPDQPPGAETERKP